MNKYTLILLCLFIFQSGIKASDYAYAFVVSFTDKANSSFSIDKPEEFLSQRAIDRRLKQNIPIIEQDLPINTNYIDQVIERGGVFHNASKWMNSAVFYTNDKEFSKVIDDLSFVKDVALVYKKSSGLKSVSTQSKFESYEKHEFSLSIDYGASDNQISMCKAEFFHDQGYLGEGMHIAVIDAGFYRLDKLPCFKHLFENNQILGTYDFVANSTDVYDTHTHGTSVMSVIAANDPGVIFGTAPEASYYLLRSEDGASEFRIEEENWIAAVEFADSAGVDLVSTSLGYSVMDDPDMTYTYDDMDGKTTRITQGSEIAFAKGMVMVNSAGNEGEDKLTAPSDGFNTLGIGAVDENRVIAPFSSRGPSFDGRVKPDVSGQGYPTAVMGPDTVVYRSSGTSFSCPLIAGMVTCLWQANPDLSNVDLIDAVRRSGHIRDNPDSETGYGIPSMVRADDIAKGGTSIRIANTNHFEVFPNPFIETLSLRFNTEQSQTFSIKIIDAFGRVVHEDFVDASADVIAEYTFSETQNWSRGLYVIVVKTDAEVLTHQVIKP